MKHLCIDLETLATSPNAVITEISYALFYPRGNAKPVIPYGIQTMHLSPWPQIAQGRSVDADTVRWRMTHAPIVEEATDMRKGLTLQNALVKLIPIMQEAEAIWAWGADFERKISEHAFAQCGLLPAIWKYPATRDARTLFFSVFPEGKPTPKSHRSADDVAATITDIRAAFRAIDTKKP